LFVHRDADTVGRAARVREIENAVEAARRRFAILIPVLPVVPIQELEAWLLCREFEPALRRAAGKPQGRIALNLPPLSRIERLTATKEQLQRVLRTASEQSGRRIQQVDSIRPADIARYIDDFSPLRQLPAFQAFEADVKRVISCQGWPGSLPDQP